MARLVVAPAALLLLACAGEEPPPEPPPPPPPPTVADFVGDYRMTNTIEGVEEPVISTVSGNASGWFLYLADRDPIALTPSISGDSLVLISEKYESILRDNVMVQVRTATVMTEVGMRGNLVATYDSEDGQELVTGTAEGEKQVP